MTAPDFASRLRELSRAASPAPWFGGHLSEAGSGCDCTYVLNEHQMGDVATFAVRKDGDEFGAEYPTKAQCVANMALTNALRNRAERIADVLDAVAAYRAARADGPVLSRAALEAMFAALDALEADGGGA